MTISLGMFIFLLIWIAVCSKPANEDKSMLAGIQVRKTDRTAEEIIREYK